jgi:hypothetical protein
MCGRAQLQRVQGLGGNREMLGIRAGIERRRVLAKRQAAR